MWLNGLIHSEIYSEGWRLDESRGGHGLQNAEQNEVAHSWPHGQKDVEGIYINWSICGRAQLHSCNLIVCVYAFNMHAVVVFYPFVKGHSLQSPTPKGQHDRTHGRRHGASKYFVCSASKTVWGRLTMGGLEATVELPSHRPSTGHPWNKSSFKKDTGRRLALRGTLSVEVLFLLGRNARVLFLTGTLQWYVPSR